MKTNINSWRHSSAGLVRLTTVVAAIHLSRLACHSGYEVDWHTVDGGGSTSTSADGRFSVSGTAGQPDAGQSASADGRFQLNGGFWYGEIVFCGCTLSITYSGGKVTVSWPCDLGGCILEATDELRSSPPATVWTPVSPQPTGHSYTVAVTDTQRYFRLRSP